MKNQKDKCCGENKSDVGHLCTCNGKCPPKDKKVSSKKSTRKE
jgi:hypothetical protein